MSSHGLGFSLLSINGLTLVTRCPEDWLSQAELLCDLSHLSLSIALLLPVSGVCLYEREDHFGDHCGRIRTKYSWGTGQAVAKTPRNDILPVRCLSRLYLFSR